MGPPATPHPAALAAKPAHRGRDGRRVRRARTAARAAPLDGGYRADARLFDSPLHYEDKLGRSARKGARQSLLSARIANPASRLRVVQFNRTSWCSTSWIEYTSGTALWHHGGKPIVPILWVLVRYPDGRREPEAFLCTDTQAHPCDVLDCCNRR